MIIRGEEKQKLLERIKIKITPKPRNITIVISCMELREFSPAFLAAESHRLTWAHLYLI